MNSAIKVASYICAAYLVYTAVSNAINVGREWNVKIRNQRENFYQVSTSRDKWRELAPFRAQWPEFFAEESAASVSRHELFKVMNLPKGLNPTVSRINQSQTHSIIQNKQALGVSKTCVRNEQNGFVMSADGLSSLFLGLRRLEERREITFSEVMLTNNLGKPQVVIRDLCVYFRTGAV